MHKHIVVFYFFSWQFDFFFLTFKMQSCDKSHMNIISFFLLARRSFFLLGFLRDSLDMFHQSNSQLARCEDIRGGVKDATPMKQKQETIRFIVKAGWSSSYFDCSIWWYFINKRVKETDPFKKQSFFPRHVLVFSDLIFSAA